MGKKSKRNRPRKKAAPAATREAPAPETKSAEISSEDEFDQLQAKVNRERAQFVGQQGPWTEERFFAFSSYFDSLQELLVETVRFGKPINATEDRKLVKQIVKSTTAPAEFRACACCLWAGMCGQFCERENSAQLYHHTIQIRNEARDNEKNQMPQWISGILQSIEDTALSRLNQLRSLGTGGHRCDACGKTANELGVAMLNCCYNCQMAFYCSRECQTLDWKRGGHKQVCRKRGEFQVGDIAYCVDVQRKIKYGMLVNVLGGASACTRWFRHQRVDVPDPEILDRFLVTTSVDLTDTFVVHRDNLRRVRSAIWKEVFNPELHHDFVKEVATPALAAIILGENEDEVLESTKCSQVTAIEEDGSIS